MHPHLRCALALCLAGIAGLCAAAETSVQVHGFSRVVHRGADLSDGRAALGASLSVDQANGAFLGLSTHYAQGTARGSRLLRYAGLHAGWFQPLARGRALELSVSRHVFDDVPDWRYDELRADLHTSKTMTITAAVSDDYYGRGSESILAEFTWQPQFEHGVFARVVGGNAWLPDADDRSFVWGTAGIGVARGRFSTELSLNTTNADRVPAPGANDTTLALRISYLWR